LDDVIRAWMEASDPTTASALLEGILLRHVSPLCRSVIRRKRYAAREGSDIESEIMVRIVGRLRAAKAGLEPPLDDARKYVLTVAFSACHALVRRSHPERARLKNRVRYLASHDPRLAIWEGQDREWLAGLRGDEGKPSRPAPDAPPAIGSRSLDDVLCAILTAAGGPLALDDLVTLAASALGIASAETNADSDRVADPRVALDIQLGHREELEWLWRELLLLPQRQRAAILLNLRDDGGHGVIELLPATGIATIRQIAEALGMTAEAFAGIWGKLPVDDLRVAEILGVTRQQVINLRRAGRFRLLRRRQKGNTAAVSVSYDIKEEI
jgi:DNA-directed RNA polymerase specialized sigma24 family protein